MSRSKRQTGKSPVTATPGGVIADQIVGSGDASGSSASVSAPKPKISSVLRGPYSAPDVMYPSLPGLIKSPFGPAYLSKRSRPIADDAVMVVATTWYHTLLGYLKTAATTGLPANYDYGETILERWFTYYRRTLENLNKHRSTVTAMTDPTVFRWYFELYHDVVANCAMILNVAKIRQLNQGLVDMTTYLTDSRISQTISYWRRLSAVRAPSFIRAKALADGNPFNDLTDRCVHVRLWRMDLRSLDGGSAWTALTSGTHVHLGQTDAGITALMADLDLGLRILEGIDSDVQADLTAMLDLIEMGSYYDSTKNVFSQGLPSESSLPGVVDGKSTFWNDVYCRAFVNGDTHGVGNDEIVCFPVMGMAELSSLIPIGGFGTPQMSDFGLFGAPKFGRLDSTDDLFSTDVANEVTLFGTDFWISSAAASVGTEALNTKGCYAYTREDGWILITTKIDWGDGEAIRGAVNGGHPWPFKHIFFPMAFAGQLDASMELRFLDSSMIDYSFYVPPEDLCLNHATMLASIFGVPSALG